MVRTRADAGNTRAAGAKAPRKNIAGPSNPNIQVDKNKGREQARGNSYCPRETPEWQKPITSFFNKPPESGESSRNQAQMELASSDLAAGGATSDDSTFREVKN